MLSSLAEVLGITDYARLNEVAVQTDSEFREVLKPLSAALAQNVTSSDPVTVREHMGYVESWRDRVTRMLMLTTALVEHAKSDYFKLPDEKGNTEFVRDQYRRRLAGPYIAIQQRLEHLIDSIDSRANLCKKITGFDVEVAGQQRRA